jgi:hypothetical protein
MNENDSAQGTHPERVENPASVDVVDHSQENPGDHNPTEQYPEGQVEEQIKRFAEYLSCGWRETEFTKRIEIGVAVTGLLVLLVYTIYTGLMYGANEKSANAAKSAAETAQRTLEQSIEAFRIDERAWVEIEPIKPVLLDNNPKFGATFTCDIYPRNVGKTVATDIVVKAQEQFSSELFGKNKVMMDSVQDKYLLDKTPQMGTNDTVHVPKNPVPKVLAPNSTSAAPFRLTCQAPQVFSGHQSIHYMVGRIDYCDQFRVKHWLKFCYFVVNARGKIWNCEEGNVEDRNSETHPDAICPSA